METCLIKPRKPLLPADFLGTSFNTKKEWAAYPKLAQVWRAMIDRCYNPNGQQFWGYMNAGITVHPNWHNPRNFIRTVVDVPQWELKLLDWEGYVLDKDYYGAKQYGPNTCAWLSKEENMQYTSRSTPLVVTFNSETKYYINVSSFSNSVHISQNVIRSVIGKGLITKGVLTGYIIDEYKGDMLVRHKLKLLY